MDGPGIGASTFARIRLLRTFGNPSDCTYDCARSMWKYAISASKRPFERVTAPNERVGEHTSPAGVSASGSPGWRVASTNEPRRQVLASSRASVLGTRRLVSSALSASAASASPDVPPFATTGFGS